MGDSRSSSRSGAEGRVRALHAKPAVAGEFGLPKPPVAEASIRFAGLEGDFNRYRTEKLGSEPDSALLLHTTDGLAALAADGWPVAPGDLGENVLVDGVPYAAMQPGTRWRVGGAVVEVARACAPCRNLRVLPYVGDERVPDFIKATHGRRGWYARVVEEGFARVGDPVRSESGS